MDVSETSSGVAGVESWLLLTLCLVSVVVVFEAEVSLICFGIIGAFILRASLPAGLTSSN